MPTREKTTDLILYKVQIRRKANDLYFRTQHRGCGLFNCQTSMKKPGVFTGYRAQKKPTVTAKVLLIFHK
ncbi:hypothetical protein PSPTOT1_0029 [Pseudomonas syringae pv. tomato T1]|nr:hypothetical protein PSPTOT1_0029 [Pseudomonas syringae pv. tomato T1]